MGQGLRFPDWPSRLDKAIEEARSKPFKWGSNDCCLFAAEVVKAIRGEDFATPFRGKYKTPLGASRLLSKAGGISSIVTGSLGEPVSPLFAMRGDVVLRDEALGICVGSKAAFTGHEGLVFHPLKECACAWRV